MAKKRMLELTNIWKDRAVPNKLKVKLIKTLVWTVMMYGSEGWTLRNSDEKKIRGTKMCFYRRLLHVSWTQKRTNRSILEELGGKKTTIGTSHQKENFILWPFIPTPGNWTNEIDVPRKSTGKKR